MKFRPLAPDEILYRDNAISAARSALGGVQGPLPRGAVQALYDFCLDQGFAPDGIHDRTPVAATGMSFGALLARELSLDWVWCEEDDLAHLALRVPGRQIVVWPLWMICRRLAEGQAADIGDMIEGVRRALAEQARESPVSSGG